MQQHLMQMHPMMAAYYPNNVTTDHIQQVLLPLLLFLLSWIISSQTTWLFASSLCIYTSTTTVLFHLIFWFFFSLDITFNGMDLWFTLLFWYAWIHIFSSHLILVCTASEIFCCSFSNIYMSMVFMWKAWHAPHQHSLLVIYVYIVFSIYFTLHAIIVLLHHNLCKFVMGLKHLVCDFIELFMAEPSYMNYQQDWCFVSQISDLFQFLSEHYRQFH